MAVSKKLSNEEEVTVYLKQLNHPLKHIVDALRATILTVDKEVGEKIKWNSLSYFYTGDMMPFNSKEYKRDIVVINLNKADYVLLVFPTGAIINDNSGLLKGNYSDGRKMAKFSSIEEVNNKKDNLQSVIKDWLVLIEK